MPDFQDLIVARKKAGLSQAQLAAKAGISSKTVSRMENGEKVDNASKFAIASALGIKLDTPFTVKITGDVRLPAVGEVPGVNPSLYFASFVLDRLSEKDLTIQEFAEAMGLNRAVVVDHLGWRSFPSDEIRQRYAAVLGMSFADFERAWRAPDHVTYRLDEKAVEFVQNEATRLGRKDLQQVAVDIIAKSFSAPHAKFESRPGVVHFVDQPSDHPGGDAGHPVEPELAKQPSPSGTQESQATGVGVVLPESGPAEARPANATDSNQRPRK